MKKLRVIISGGGTGGHIFPALAIAKSLEEKVDEIEFLFVGAKNRMEMEKVPLSGYPIKGLWISGLQRRFTSKNLLFPFKLLFSLIRAFQIVKKFKPDIAIGTGGFASGPLMYVAAKKNIPCIIQEQNSYPGITNKILSKYVNKICVAYDKMERFFPKEKLIFTGNPIRKELLNLPNEKTKSFEHFKINKDAFTVLVIGGSLGALSINSAIKNGLVKIKQSQINLIWQTGLPYFNIANQSVNEINSKNIIAYPFIKEMDLAYNVADIVVSRAGAIAISELCCIGKPTILVPSPNVSEDHQYKNAQSLVNKNAAVLVKDIEANSKLVNKLIDLVNDKKTQKKLSDNIKKLSKKDAANFIADIALNMLNK